MIFGQIDDWRENLRGELWDRAFGFLATLSCDMAEGRYPLDGENM